MIQQILNQAKEFNAIIAELKEKSSYYPKVLIAYYETHSRMQETNRQKHNRFIDALAGKLLNKKPKEVPKTCYASTLVRINRDGKWYVVHCVESVYITPECDEKNMLLRLALSVHQIQNLYKITGQFEDVDTLQISEEERLTNQLVGGKI